MKATITEKDGKQYVEYVIHFKGEIQDTLKRRFNGEARVVAIAEGGRLHIEERDVRANVSGLTSSSDDRARIVRSVEELLEGQVEGFQLPNPSPKRVIIDESTSGSTYTKAEAVIINELIQIHINIYIVVKKSGKFGSGRGRAVFVALDAEGKPVAVFPPLQRTVGSDFNKGIAVKEDYQDYYLTPEQFSKVVFWYLDTDTFNDGFEPPIHYLLSEHPQTGRTIVVDADLVEHLDVGESKKLHSGTVMRSD